VTYRVFGPQTIIVDGAEHRLTQRRERTPRRLVPIARTYTKIVS
jgi:hypothetical protein